ncbi:MAG: tautomerase family protein [Siculibacillus sp.]|nr:tautomerase family protein [Siculibacillus sp.]
MPSLTVDFSTPRPGAATLTAEVASLVLDLTERHLGKKRALTAVSVAERPAATWFVGGASLAELGQASHRTVIRVTEGTNTKAEKARFVAAVHEGMGRLLGPMRPESYVVVEEVRADAWGWGGETQEHRAVAEKLAGEAEAALVFDAYRRFGVR